MTIIILKYLIVLFWVEVCSPKRYTEVLTPITSERDLRGNEVKMRSFKWALIQYDWSLNKKGKCGQWDTHREKKMWRYTWLEWWHLQAKGCQDWWQTLEAKSGKEGFSPWTIRESKLCPHLDFLLLASRLWDNNFVVLSHPIFGTLL